MTAERAGSEPSEDPARRFERLHALFDRARELADAERAAFVDASCAGDDDLRRELGDLLAAHEGQGPAMLSDAGIEGLRGKLEGVLSLGSAADAGALQQVGPYRIVRRIAEGGMGVVYEAEQDSPRRRIALKVVHPLFATPQRLRRFRQEAELLGRLAHPGIAQIHEAGTFASPGGERPYFAMEYVEGTDLLTHAETTKLTQRGRLALLAEVCDAVQHAHERGVVHRDLKPDNVLVDADGRPKVLDFGVARASEGSTVLTTMVTEEGDLLGTIAYMAPEQLSGLPDAITPRADVYGLGAIAFELLAGRLPHDLVGLPLAAAIEIARNKEPARLGDLRPELKGDVETIVGKALEKEPERRYASAADLADDLRAFLDHRPIRARPPSAVYRAVKFTRRNKALVVGTLTTFAAVAAGLVVSVLFAVQSSRNAVLASAGERRAVAGVLQATQDLLERDDLWRAASSFGRVADRASGWEVELLERVLPTMLPARYAARSMAWVDEEHLAVTVPEGGVAVLEVGTWRETRRLFSDRHFRGLSRSPSPRGWELLEKNSRWRATLADLATGEVLRSVESDEGNVHCLLGDDGTTLDLVHALDRVWRFRRDDDRPLSSPDGRLPLMRGDVFPSPDGERIAVLDDARGLLRLYDTRTGACLGELDGLRSATCARVRFLPDGRELLTFDRELHLLRVDVDTVRIVRRYDIVGDTCDIGDVSTDGALYAHAPPNRPVEVYDLTSGELVHARPVELLVDRNHYVHFSPSGRLLLVRGRETASCILDLDRPCPGAEVLGTDDPRVTTYRGHEHYVYGLALAPDGRTAASLSVAEPCVRVWDVATGRTLATFEKPVADAGPWNRDQLLAFSPDGRRVLATAREGWGPPRMIVWDLVSGERTETPPDPESVGTHSMLLDRFVDALGPGARQRLGRTAYLKGDGTALALTSYDKPTGTEPFEPVHISHLGGTALALSPDGRRMAIAGARLVRVLDRASGLELASLPGHAYAVDWSPDGRLLAAGGSDGRIRLIDGELLTEALSFAAHDDYVFALCWTPDGTRLVSASGDATVRVWDPRAPSVREAERLADEERVAALRGSSSEELEARFAAAATADERGAIVRAALERSAAR